MKYILYVMNKGMIIQHFIGLKANIKQVPKDMILKYVDEYTNITQGPYQTSQMNKLLNSNYSVGSVDPTLDLHNELCIIYNESDIKTNYYLIRMIAKDHNNDCNIVRKPKAISVDDIVNYCNKYNQDKTLRIACIDTKSEIDKYYDRLDKAYRRYDSVILSKSKSVAIGHEPYNQIYLALRLLNKDLYNAVQKAIEGKLTIDEIREVELRVAEERVRRMKYVR